MISGFSRRAFFAGLGGFAVGVVTARDVFADVLQFCGRGTVERRESGDVTGEQTELLYPPVDLSYFEKQIGYRA